MNFSEWIHYRFLNSFKDPIRRRNTFARIVESYVPSALVLGIVTQSLWSLAGAAVIVFGEYALYEYILEKYGWAGHYWERGPRDGETYKIG